MIEIENPDTGEVRVLEPDANGKYPNVRVPWRVKGAVQGKVAYKMYGATAPTVKDNAVVHGLYKRAGSMLRASGKLFGIDCKPCGFRDRAMAKVAILGVERANYFLKRSFRVQPDTPEFEALEKELQDALDAAKRVD